MVILNNKLRKASFLLIISLFTGCGYSINSTLYQSENSKNSEKQEITCIKTNKDFINQTSDEEEKNFYGISMFYFALAKVDVSDKNCDLVYKIYKKTFSDNNIKAVFSNDFTKEHFIKTENKNYGATVYKLAIARENNNSYDILWEGIYQKDINEPIAITPDLDKYTKDDSKVIQELVNSFFHDSKSNKYAGVNWTKELTTGIIEVTLTHQIGKSVNSIYDANTTPSFNSPQILK